jgi:hypothetical protein
MRQPSTTSTTRFLVGCLLLLAGALSTTPFAVTELIDALPHHHPAGHLSHSTQAEAAIPRTTVASVTALPPVRVMRGPMLFPDTSPRVVVMAAVQAPEYHQQRVLRI